MEVFNNTFEAEFEGFTPVADGDSIVKVTLPQEWYEINEKLEEDHRIMGGLIYKDMDGVIKVTPLAPPYGIREDECGVAMNALVMYNSKQQIMCKPATDGRHTVSLQQLDQFFGGIDSESEKTFSIKRVNPVDTSVPVGDRLAYVFCRDSENNFAGKPYSEKILGDVLVERDANGDIIVNNPKKSLHPVNLEHLENVLLDYVSEEDLEKIFGTIANPNFIANDTNKVESGTRNALTGKNNTVKSGNCNHSSASGATIQGDCNEISGWTLNVYGDGDAVSGSGHELGNTANGYKVNYAKVSGQGHKVGKDKTVRYVDVSGVGHTINHDGVDASGSGHKSSRDYQVLRGYGSQQDDGAAFILAIGKNIFTVGANGTRENISTDAVTVDFLKKYVENAIASIPNAKGVGF